MRNKDKLTEANQSTTNYEWEYSGENPPKEIKNFIASELLRLEPQISEALKALHHLNYKICSDLKVHTFPSINIKTRPYYNLDRIFLIKLSREIRSSLKGKFDLEIQELMPYTFDGQSLESICFVNDLKFNNWKIALHHLVDLLKES